MWYRHKHKYMFIYLIYIYNIWKSMESTKIKPYIYSQFIFNKGVKVIQLINSGWLTTLKLINCKWCWDI